MFTTARIKLTAWYLLIIMLVSLFFSAIIYRLLFTEIERLARIQRIRIESRFEIGQPPFNWRRELPPPLSSLDTEVVEDARRRLLSTLLSINGGILLVSGALGYFLAGRTLKPIQIMLDDQNRFISDASHEFRTPLTSIRTSLEVGLRDPKTNLRSARKLITDSLSQIVRLQQLSDYLLDISRYQNSHLPLPSTTLPLKTIVSRSISRLKPQSKIKKIKIIARLPRIDLVGDVDKLTDLFAIIIDNAIKYSHPGKAIKIAATSSGKFVIITISDRGIGISSEDLPHVFDRFYRADPARSPSAPAGYGLGLSIAKNIVNLHSGSITIQSRLRHGTTVTVSLPQPPGYHSDQTLKLMLL